MKKVPIGSDAGQMPDRHGRRPGCPGAHAPTKIIPANVEDAKRLLDAGGGLSMVTHLGNGCALDLPRHDNFIQRAMFLRERLWICFIPDGVHVPFFALANYLAITGLDRTIVVTDAIVAAKLPPGRYLYGEGEVVVDAAGAGRA